MKFPRRQFNPFLNYFYEKVSNEKVLKVVQSLCLHFFPTVYYLVTCLVSLHTS